MRKIHHKIFLSLLRNIFGTITHVSTKESVVSLTFDDGPHPEYTPHLLEILEKYNARATFFVIGKAAQKFPDLLRQIAEGGHAIGNHSWDHTSFPLITGPERRRQIRACAKAIAPYGQRLFRPPYGHQSLRSRFDAFLLGYQVVTWSVIASDWLDYDKDKLVRQLAGSIEPGSVVVLHDALHDYLEDKYADRESTIEAVKMLLEGHSDRFRFVTIPELFKHGRPQRQNWYMKTDVDFLNALTTVKGEVRPYAQR